MSPCIPVNTRSLASFCRSHGIRRLSFFGSVLRPDFDAQRSDVDVLVEFEPQAEQGLTYFDLARMKRELESLFGRAVDLALANSLDRHFRDEILATAQVQYDAA